MLGRLVSWLATLGFDAAAVGPNVWLQSFASDGLTRAANVVSFFGYNAVHVAFSVLLAFAWRLRAGAALLVLLERRAAWAWGLALVWIVAMAWSRMYLGRHFLADVVGGAALASAVLAVAFGLLRLRRFDARPALGVALALAVLSWLTGMPGGYDAARLLGFAAGACIAFRRDTGRPPASIARATRDVALAAAVFAATWYALPEGVVRGGAAAFAVLAVPAWLTRRPAAR